MPNYGESGYWDKRYMDQYGKVYDWLESFERLREVIEKTCTFESKILMLGCGNSILSEDLYEKGYEYITNIDISKICIEQMARRNEHMANMKYMVMDARNLEFDDFSFDVVIDKSTIDSLLCSDDAYLNVGMMLKPKEVSRVLKPDGYYLCITYGAPDFRIEHLTREHLSFTIETFKFEPKNPQDGYHYSYVCKKNQNADRVREENWEQVMKHLMIDEEKEKLMFLSEKVQRELEKDIKLPEDDLDDDAHDKQFKTEESDIKDEDFMANFMKDEDVELAISKLAEEFAVIKQEEDADSEEEEETKKDPEPSKPEDKKGITAQDSKTNTIDSKAGGSTVKKSDSQKKTSTASLNQNPSDKSMENSHHSKMSQEISKSNLASQRSQTQTEFNGTQGSNTRKTSEVSKSKITTPRTEPKSMESSYHSKEKDIKPQQSTKTNKK